MRASWTSLPNQVSIGSVRKLDIWRRGVTRRQYTDNAPPTRWRGHRFGRFASRFPLRNRSLARQAVDEVPAKRGLLEVVAAPIYEPHCGLLAWLVWSHGAGPALAGTFEIARS